MRFTNPTNNYTEEVHLAFLWTLLFGTLYFLVKGVWTHALISLILAIITSGFSWLIYPFFAKGIIRTNFLKKGWVEIEQNSRPEAFDSWSSKYYEKLNAWPNKYKIFAGIVIFVLLSNAIFFMTRNIT